jgi:prepilin-type N-terminal cleavage/methylation domain-containing protein
MAMSRGFTLLETLIYLAILSILIVAGVASAYAILDIGGRGAKGIIIASEGNFLIRKIDWALSGATKINVSDPLSTMVITKGGIDYTFSIAAEVVKLNGTDISSVNVAVVGSGTGGKAFEYFPKSGRMPCGIHVTLGVSGVPFEVTRYLRVDTLCI